MVSIVVVVIAIGVYFGTKKDDAGSGPGPGPGSGSGVTKTPVIENLDRTKVFINKRMTDADSTRRCARYPWYGTNTIACDTTTGAWEMKHDNGYTFSADGTTFCKDTGATDNWSDIDCSSNIADKFNIVKDDKSDSYVNIRKGDEKCWVASNGILTCKSKILTADNRDGTYVFENRADASKDAFQFKFSDADT